MKTGTDRRTDMVAYIADYEQQHGYAPSLREIMRAVGLRSPSVVHYHLQVLQKQGLLNRDKYLSRAIKLLRGKPSKKRSGRDSVSKAKFSTKYPMASR